MFNSWLHPGLNTIPKNCVLVRILPDPCMSAMHYSFVMDFVRKTRHVLTNHFLVLSCAYSPYSLFHHLKVTQLLNG